jgi:predicted HicB family RNase H-like nuclease
MSETAQLMIKIDPKLRQAAKVKAAQQGTTVSEVIRKALIAFVASGKMKGGKPMK